MYECVAVSVPAFQGHLSRADELTESGEPRQNTHCAVDQSLATAPTIHTSSMAATSRRFQPQEPSGSRCFWNTSCCWAVVSSKVDCCPRSPADAASSWLETHNHCSQSRSQYGQAQSSAVLTSTSQHKCVSRQATSEAKQHAVSSQTLPRRF